MVRNVTRAGSGFNRQRFHVVRFDQQLDLVLNIDIDAFNRNNGLAGSGLEHPDCRELDANRAGRRRSFFTDAGPDLY